MDQLTDDMQRALEGEDPTMPMIAHAEPTSRLVKLFELPCFNVGVCEVGECPVVYYRPAHARTSSNNT